MDDIIQWFAGYDIQLDAGKLNLTVDNFSSFIKAPNKYGVKLFFDQIGLDQHKDIQMTKRLEQGRIFLVNEECDFYCTKHGYPLIAEKNKHRKKKRRDQSKSKADD